MNVFIEIKKQVNLIMCVRNVEKIENKDKDWMDEE